MVTCVARVVLQTVLNGTSEPLRLGALGDLCRRLPK